MMRRASLAVVVSTVTGLALAQPPVPMPISAAGMGAAEVVRPEAAIDDPARTLASKTERVARLEAELAGLRQRRERSRDSLRERARALYRIRKSGALPKTGGFEALLARRGRLERLEQVILDDARRVRDYTRRIDVARRSLETARAEAEEATRRHDLEVAAERAIEEHLGAVDLGVGALPPLPVAPIPDVPVVATAVGTAPVQVVDPTSFAALRGRLGLPITSALGIRDAVRDDGPGLEFLARAGTAVMAVASGRVAFANDYGSYGRMIILDHGDTFYTIYAGLGRISVRVGDYVERGGLLAEVGGSATTSPALFFEVRRGTRSLDTRSWIGVAR